MSVFCFLVQDFQSLVQNNLSVDYNDLTTKFYSNTKVQNKIQIIVLMENINS